MTRRAFTLNPTYANPETGRSRLWRVVRADDRAVLQATASEATARRFAQMLNDARPGSALVVAPLEVS